MIGDKLVIEQHHTDRAVEICTLLRDRIAEGFTITVAGESGSGKSELAWEIARLLTEEDVPVNHGCFAPVTVVVPPHSVLSPDFPAAVSAGNRLWMAGNDSFLAPIVTGDAASNLAAASRLYSPAHLSVVCHLCGRFDGAH